MLSFLRYNGGLTQSLGTTFPVFTRKTSISIGHRPICNPRFADDIDLMGGSNGELQDLTGRLVDRARAYGMEVSTEINKIMTNRANISAAISMNGQKLEGVTSFRELGAALCKDGICSAEIRSWVASAMGEKARLNRIYRCNTISFVSKFKLCKSLVTMFFLFGCETWTLLAHSEKKRCRTSKPSA